MSLFDEKFRAQLVEAKSGKFAPKEKASEVFGIDGSLKIAESIYAFLSGDDVKHGTAYEQAYLLWTNGVRREFPGTAMNLEGNFGERLDAWFSPLLKYLPGDHHPEKDRSRYTQSPYPHEVEKDWKTMQKSRAPKEVKTLFQSTLNVIVEKDINGIMEISIQDFKTQNEGAMPTDELVSSFFAEKLFHHEIGDYLYAETSRKLLEKYHLSSSEYINIIAKHFGSKTATEMMRKYYQKGLIDPSEYRSLQKELKQYPKTRSRT